MRNAKLLRAVAGVAAVAAMVACSDSAAPNRVLSTDDALLGTFAPPGGTSFTAQAERLEVCKRYQMTSGAPVPASTSFNFTSVADPGKNQSFSITSGLNNVYACREIWLDGGSGGSVTVVEPALTGFITRITRIEDIGGVETTPVNDVLGNSLSGLVSGSAGPNSASTGQLFLFTNIEEVNTGGCTLTQGYWKTHSIYGPAGPADPVWNDPQIGGPDAIFFYSGMSWIDLFNTPPKKGNAYIQLAHQYMAAALNIESGATPAPAEFALATAFFNNAANTPNTVYDKATTDLLRTWAGALGAFNEGTTGPGHCQDT